MMLQMSETGRNKTKQIAIRDLTVKDKQRIRELIKYGDVGRIASKCPHVKYDTVSKTINPNHSTDHERVWIAAVEYLQSLPKIEIDARLESFIKNGVAA